MQFDSTQVERRNMLDACLSEMNLPFDLDGTVIPVL